MENKKEPSSKLPYEKPRLRTIHLAAEEVMVTKCKKSPANTLRHNPGGCGANPCSGVGGS